LELYKTPSQFPPRHLDLVQWHIVQRLRCHFLLFLEEPQNGFAHEISSESAKANNPCRDEPEDGRGGRGLFQRWRWWRLCNSNYTLRSTHGAAIALFITVDHFVPAIGQGTICSAYIGSGITILRAIITFFSTLLHAIPTGRKLAEVGTGVEFILIRIVTLFSGIHDSIPAYRKLAARAAGCRFCITIQRAGVALFAFLQNTIAAGRDRAGIGAGVRIVFIAVIAHFAFVHYCVSTVRHLAIQPTAGRIIGIAHPIIALLAGLYHSVSAHGTLTKVRTEVCVNLISIVTLFTGIHNIVPAQRKCAIGTTRIG
jgi:hypothetical protein